MPSDDRSVGEHYACGDYARGDLLARIFQALRAAGRDPYALTPRDLAPIDQLHARGREATLELARLAGTAARTRVFDVGGASRTGAQPRNAPSQASSATRSRCWSSPKGSAAARGRRSPPVRV